MHDAVSSTGVATTTPATPGPLPETGKALEKKEDEEFSSKAQIMTLMTTDVDRVADFAWHLFTLVDRYSHPFPIRSSPNVISSPIELAIGSIFLYVPFFGFVALPESSR